MAKVALGLVSDLLPDLLRPFDQDLPIPLPGRQKLQESRKGEEIAEAAHATPTGPEAGLSAPATPQRRAPDPRHPPHPQGSEERRRAGPVMRASRTSLEARW